MKTQLTKNIEKQLFYMLQKKGTFCCPEVKLGMGRKGKKGIVDYLAITTKGVVTCFEIKVTKQDLVSSSHGHNFYGNYNYYVIPASIYLEVKDYVPNYVGILLYYENTNPNDYYLHTMKYQKYAKYLTIKNLSDMKMYMLRSLYREFQKKVMGEKDGS